jgi:hypothetical protein
MRRRRWGIWLSLALAAAVLSAGSAGARTSARPSAEPAPVASLEPAATAELWRRLVSTRARRARSVQECRPLRGVFYAATDYLRLATKLAAAASPCAEYYISVPPLVADKTQPRRDAAWRIRALGPNFHAMAEFHFTTWNRWVASTGASWYQAGVIARERMAAAGYDFAGGDTWVVNELSSAVRRGTGNARANIRELLRGLYEGEGTHPTRGAAFVIGVGQQAADVSLYQTNLQNWFTDSAFWADMSTYVSDWSQEVYGDMRNYAVPGASEPVRRDYLNDYLQHELVLAGVGPPTIDTARSFLQSTYSPLANAAWEREAGYGWTMVSAEQMAAYVSTQVHALRYFGATTAQPQDHWGFAWAPRNGTGMSAADFAEQSGQVLDRLGASIRDSADAPDPADPGAAACGPTGQNVWCLADVPGARLTEAWKSFRAWTQSVLEFVSPPETLRAGVASGPMNIALVTASGLAVTTPGPLTVTLSSSSPRGTFATTPAGPWSGTLSLAIAAGTGSSEIFYYRDTRAGTPALTAAAAGATIGTQTLTVTPAAVATLALRPAAATVAARTSLRFTATGRDAFGNAVQVPAAWSLTPRSLGSLEPASANVTTTFTAGRMLGPGTITAAVPIGVGTISASAGVTVTPGRLRIGEIRYQELKRAFLLTVRAIDLGGRPISGAVLSVRVVRSGRRVFSARAATGPAGKAAFRVPAARGGCFTATLSRASAVGFTWDGRTPRNRYCLPRRS